MHILTLLGNEIVYVHNVTQFGYSACIIYFELTLWNTVLCIITSASTPGYAASG